MSAHQLGLLSGFTLGGVLFFCANTVALAHGTGSVGEAWTAWMTQIPGLSASFTGACVGFAYGVVAGYLLGRGLGKLSGR